MMRVMLIFVMLLTTGSVFAEEKPRVVMNTSQGEIVLELDTARAPVTAANFLTYVDEKAFDGTIFHRVIPGFMIQGGGYYADMREASAHDTIRNEADNGLKNVPGTIAMARTNIIDSAARQFFINVSNNTNLDHRPDSCTRTDEAKQMAANERGMRKPMTCASFGYAVFGRVVTGMNVVKSIEAVDTGFHLGHQNVPLEPIVINSVKRVADPDQTSSGEDAEHE